MTIALSRWEAKEIVVPTATWTMTLDEAGGAAGATVTIAAATHTWATLCAAIATALEAASGWVTPDYECSISDGEGGTGRLTINETWVGSEFTLTKVSQDLWDLMGFDASPITSSSYTYTGPDHVKGMWLPDGAHLCTVQFGDEIDESDMTVLESPDATNVSYLTYHRKRILPDLTYQTVTRQRTRIAGEVYANESFAQFWRDVINDDKSYFTVGKVRIFPDADTDATYYDYWVGEGMKSNRPVNVKEGWQRLWTIRLPRMVRIET